MYKAWSADSPMPHFTSCYSVVILMLGNIPGDELQRSGKLPVFQLHLTDYPKMDNRATSQNWNPDIPIATWLVGWGISHKSLAQVPTANIEGHISRWDMRQTNENTFFTKTVNAQDPRYVSIYRTSQGSNKRLQTLKICKVSIVPLYFNDISPSVFHSVLNSCSTSWRGTCVWRWLKMANTRMCTSRRERWALCFNILFVLE